MDWDRASIWYICWGHYVSNCLACVSKATTLLWICRKENKHSVYLLFISICVQLNLTIFMLSCWLSNWVSFCFKDFYSIQIDKWPLVIHSLFFIRTREFQSRLDVLKFSLGRASYVLIMFLKCSQKNGAEAQCS